MREVSIPKDTLGYSFECVKLEPYMPEFQRDIDIKEYCLTIKIKEL